jgi:hypothetical protein
MTKIGVDTEGSNPSAERRGGHTLPSQAIEKKGQTERIKDQPVHPPEAKDGYDRRPVSLRQQPGGQQRPTSRRDLPHEKVHRRYERQSHQHVKPAQSLQTCTKSGERRGKRLVKRNRATSLAK